VKGDIVAAGTDNKVLIKLEEQQKKEGSLPELLEFYQKLLKIQSRVGQGIDLPSPSFSSDVIKKRTERGKPLLKFSDLVLDWPLLRDTFAKVTAIFAEYPELFGPVPKELEELKPGRFPAKKAVKAWFDGAELPAGTVPNNGSEALVRNLIQASIKPFLVQYSTAQLGLIDQERWRRGYCPVCGGNPDIGFLDMESGSRWLVCSRCDAEWIYKRLECPYCGTADQNALAYFTDDEGLYRLYVCEQCKHYLKTVDLRQAKSEVLIPLERVLTLDIDSQARELGYSPCD
jgi:FdhE protein